ncbi:MAG: hypothetical protein ACLTBV_04795 [Enterocloster bolteae]
MKIAVTVAGSEAKESAFVVWRGFKESLKKASLNVVMMGWSWLLRMRLRLMKAG